MESEPGKKRRLSLSQQVVIALGLGIATGLFLGELAGAVYIVGEIFVLLLKMTALPYVTVSLIAAIGGLSYQEATTFALKVGGLLIISWVLSFAVILAVPLSFPQWESASFFSSSLIEAPRQVDFLELYIPSNPFYSLANNVVPAVVFFSVAMGVALIGMKNKESLLQDVQILSEALVRITKWVARLNPLGVFALSASLVGTMSIEEFSRIQVYLVSNVVSALILIFVVLPLMISTLTALKYRQVLGETKDVLILALVSGSMLAVLPLLVERAKGLMQLLVEDDETTESAVEVIIPAFFNFPKAGQIVALGFVLFAAWFNGSSIAATGYAQLAGSGLLSMFGGVMTAIPFLLDLYQIPADMLQLFLSTGVINGPLGTLLNTMHNLTLGLLGACAVGGLVVVRWGKILRNAALAAAITGIALVGMRLFFTYTLENEYEKDRIIANMQLSQNPLAATVYTAEAPPPARPGNESGEYAVDRIAAAGTLRGGYMADDLPFAFFNSNGDLVGFDIDMAHALARDLNVELELMPVTPDSMAAALRSGHCDVILSGTAITPQRAQTVLFTDSHIDETIAFVVKDHRRGEFSDRESVEQLKDLRIGVPDIPYFVAKLHEYLPDAEIVTLGDIRDFFDERDDELDALVFTAEAGSAWTLLYPEYSVVIPQPLILSVPISYAVARGDWEMAQLVNKWLELKKKDQTLQSLYDYWVLGKDSGPKKPRWSIVRDVLHWID